MPHSRTLSTLRLQSRLFPTPPSSPPRRPFEGTDRSRAPAPALPARPLSPASSSASTLPPSPPPAPKLHPDDVPILGSAATETVELLAAVRARTSTIKKVQRDLQVAAQRLVALRAAEKRGPYGASSAVVVDSLPGEDCPICLEKLTSPSSSIARCGHMFHRHCIERHMMQRVSPECPICRQSMHVAELVQVMSGIPEARDDIRGAPAMGEGSGETALEDAEVVIDLVDIDATGSQESERGEGSGKGDTALVRLAGGMQSAIAELRHEIQSFAVVAKTVEVLEKRERGRKAAAARQRKAREKEQMQLRDEYSTLKKDAYRHLADLKHDREELRQKGAEVNDELSAAKKIRINLDLLKKELEVKENELELERAKVGEEQLHCLQTKKRYEALIKSRQTKEMLDKRQKDVLPTQGRKKVRRVSAEGAPSSDDESGDDDKASNTTHLSATFRSEGTRSQSERPLAVFGSQLSKPSRLNRPVAPRRDRAKLSQFTPKRSKVQRPMGGVGARSRIR